MLTLGILTNTSDVIYNKIIVRAKVSWGYYSFWHYYLEISLFSDLRSGFLNFVDPVTKISDYRKPISDSMAKEIFGRFYEISLRHNSINIPTFYLPESYREELMDLIAGLALNCRDSLNNIELFKKLIGKQFEISEWI